MPLTAEDFEVEVRPFYRAGTRDLLGYAPVIVTREKRFAQCLALGGPSVSINSQTFYPTPEEALAAYETATPVDSLPGAAPYAPLVRRISEFPQEEAAPAGE
jgi:hypothetical protein